MVGSPLKVIISNSGWIIHGIIKQFGILASKIKLTYFGLINVQNYFDYCYCKVLLTKTWQWITSGVYMILFNYALF